MDSITSVPCLQSEIIKSLVCSKKYRSNWISGQPASVERWNCTKATEGGGGDRKRGGTHTHWAGGQPGQNKKRQVSVWLRITSLGLPQINMRKGRAQLVDSFRSVKPNQQKVVFLFLFLVCLLRLLFIFLFIFSRFHFLPKEMCFYIFSNNISGQFSWNLLTWDIQSRINFGEMKGHGPTVNELALQ